MANKLYHKINETLTAQEPTIQNLKLNVSKKQLNNFLISKIREKEKIRKYIGKYLNFLKFSNINLFILLVTSRSKQLHHLYQHQVNRLEL